MYAYWFIIITIGPRILWLTATAVTIVMVKYLGAVAKKYCLYNYTNYYFIVFVKKVSYSIENIWYF